MSAMHSLPSVLQITDTFSYGGTEKTMQILCAALERHGYSVHAAAWSSGGAREDWLRARVSHVVAFHEDANALATYIREHRIQIVHVHRSNHEMLHVLSVLQDISNIVVIETNAFGKITHSPIENVVDYRLFVSAFCAKRFLQHHPHVSRETFLERNTVLYNPIDPADFPAYSVEQVEVFRRSLGIRPEERVLCRVGRADTAKFGDMTVRMLPYVLERMPSVRLVLQSAPKRTKRLIDALQLSEHVIILPETAVTEELGLLYASSDVMAHSSLIGETFGCSMAEAMLYRVPVVVNATPYFDNAQTEVVDNARTGYVVDNAQSFGEAVALLLSDASLRKEFGDAGRNKVMDSYAVNSVVAQLEHMYAYACERKSVRPLFPHSTVNALDDRATDIYKPHSILAAYEHARAFAQKRYFSATRRLSNA